ncbi:glycosyltransferase [Roseateles asaccharophilus]|uniref:Glycosyltransferase involved in cell wall biosynthesis n=1 Tax=Roseateles asaccharophilus TaxID=582607 RepID=A0ABU2ACB1_9BURK|nr:glycosyltransferase [Roseateles asaccharophilus]MDR7334836.1 glycosyltransferase involved in cell wall biosynthesis [Roseateles asaccharophilus]
MMKEISVIICSKNRGASLEAAIEALSRVQFGGSWEVIIVDNASTDDTQQRAARALAKVPVPSRIIHEARPGNGHGRNSAIAIAEGKVAFFTDDDCIVEPDALNALSKEFVDPTVGFVAGRINLFNPLDHLCCYFYSSKPLSFSAPWFLKPGFVQGSNMAFRLSALVEEVGGFDPIFGAGARFAGEDLELAMRFLLAGWKGKYSPDVVVRHNHGRDFNAYRKLEGFYDEGVGAYIEKLTRDPRCGLLTRVSIGAYLARLGARSNEALERVRQGRTQFAAMLQQ